MIRDPRSLARLAVVAAACLYAGAACDSSKKNGATGPLATPGPVDPKAFTDEQVDRMRTGFSSVNVPQLLLQRTHPTGVYVSSDHSRMMPWSDRRGITARATVYWTGGVTGTQYQTDFTIEITKDRVRLTVERDTAVFKIDPNQLRLAELDLTNIIRPLY